LWFLSDYSGVGPDRIGNSSQRTWQYYPKRWLFEAEGSPVDEWIEQDCSDPVRQSVKHFIRIYIPSTSTKRICLISFVSQQVGLFLLSLISLKVPLFIPIFPQTTLTYSIIRSIFYPTPNTFSILNKKWHFYQMDCIIIIVQ
jgi:hypothetical protein